VLCAGRGENPNSRLSPEHQGVSAYRQFPGTITGDLNLYQFSVNGQTYLTSGRLRPFVNGGIGACKFSPGPTRFGGKVGAGLLYSLTSQVGLQGSYNFHIVDTPEAATKFSTLQAGIRLVY
jgi:opacity protein-like surface antigen